MTFEHRVASLERWRLDEDRKAADRAMWRMWFGVNALIMLGVGALAFEAESFI